MKLGIVSKIIKWALALFFSSTILAVVAYRFIPVYITPLMVIRCFQQVSDGESVKMKHHWVALDNISPHLPVAVMASEDQRFLLHHGFDFDAIEKAARRNRSGSGRKLRPGQRNTFLAVCCEMVLPPRSRLPSSRCSRAACSMAL